jgi:hypothetical protein
VSPKAERGAIMFFRAAGGRSPRITAGMGDNGPAGGVERSREMALMADVAPTSWFPEVEPGGGWTVESLARFPDDGLRYEIIDGSLHVSPPPVVVHRHYVDWLRDALKTSMPADLACLENVGVVLPAPRTTMFVPDLTAFRCAVAGRFADRRSNIDAAEVVLVVEVMSPGSATMDRVVKPAGCAAAGIPFFLRLEPAPAGPTVYVHRRHGDGYARIHEVRPGEAVTLSDPWPIRIAPPPLGAP